MTDENKQQETNLTLSWKERGLLVLAAVVGLATASADINPIVTGLAAAVSGLTGAALLIEASIKIRDGIAKRLHFRP